MLNSFSEISWLGVFLAFVVYFILGGLWFTLLFKRPYARSLGKEVGALENSEPIFFVGPAICSLVITIANAWLIAALGISSLDQAFLFALLVGIGYLVANTVNIAINPNIPHPLRYGLISGSFHLVGIILASIILVAMA